MVRERPSEASIASEGRKLTTTFVILSHRLSCLKANQVSFVPRLTASSRFTDQEVWFTETVAPKGRDMLI